MSDKNPLKELQDEIAGAMKHTISSEEEVVARVSEQAQPMDWHTFDRALLVFLAQTEAKMGFFLREFIDLEGEPDSLRPSAYTKALWGIQKHAQTLRQLLLLSANYMTDEEKERLLDTSSLHDLLKRDDS